MMMSDDEWWWWFSDGLLRLWLVQMKDRGAFRILLDTYVTEESGTGVVHQAPYFGEVRHWLYTEPVKSCNLKFTFP